MKRVGKKFVRRAECVSSQPPELSARNRLARFRDDKRKPDGEKVPSSEEEVETEMPGEKNVQTSSKQETLSRFKDDKRKPDRQWQHQRCREFRNVKDKDFQDITQSAVPARWSGFVPFSALLCLYRFFPLLKLPSPGLPGLYLYNYT